ncbi:MAG: F0F1 ATP synthase subunit B [Mariprofundales bacterium]
MSLDLTFIGQIVVFITLVIMLKKYMYGPINDLMEQRAKKISDGLAAASEGAQAREQAEKDARQELDTARNKAQQILAAAEKRAAKERENILTKARGEAEQIVTNAGEEATAEMQRARQTLRQEVSSLAIVVAERVLEAEINANRHKQLIAQAINEGIRT